MTIFDLARDYQNLAIKHIRKAFARGDKHALLESPTGTGKTFIFSLLAKLILGKDNKVLVLTHRRKLLDQSGKSFKKFNLYPFFIQAGQKFISSKHNCFIAMTKSLQNRMKDPKFVAWLQNEISVIVIDEAHLQHFNWLFESGLVDDKYVLGVTATPRRSGKMRQLGLDYDTMLHTISVAEAIKRDYLVNCDMQHIGGIASSEIKFDPLKGDFQDKAMFQAFDNGKMYKGLLKNYEELCPNTKTIVFCCNIEHTIRTALELHNAGYSVKYVVSKVNRPKLPSDLENAGKMIEYKERLKIYDLYIDTFELLSGEQDDVLAEFENNEFQFLLNKDILTAGYDCPDIETVVIYRITQSVMLWLQMLGRGSRISEATGKTHFTALYFGDNFSDLGAYDLDREWSLWHEESSGGGLPPLKNCGIDAFGKPLRDDMEGCKRLIHASWMICKHRDCGYQYPVKEVKEVELSGVIFDADNKRYVEHKRVKDMSMVELEEHRARKGYKMPWFWTQLYIRGGLEMIDSYGKEKQWKINTIQFAKEYIEKTQKKHS